MNDEEAEREAWDALQKSYPFGPGAIRVLHQRTFAAALRFERARQAERLPSSIEAAIETMAQRMIGWAQPPRDQVRRFVKQILALADEIG